MRGRAVRSGRVAGSAGKRLPVLRNGCPTAPVRYCVGLDAGAPCKREFLSPSPFGYATFFVNPVLGSVEVLIIQELDQSRRVGDDPVQGASLAPRLGYLGRAGRRERRCSPRAVAEVGCVLDERGASPSVASQRACAPLFLWPAPASDDAAEPGASEFHYGLSGADE